MSVDSALQAMKAILQGIDTPSGQTTPSAVVVYPDEIPDLSGLDTAPVFVVHRLMVSVVESMERDTIDRKITDHHWFMEIMFYLDNQVTKDPQAQRAEGRINGWPEAFNRAITFNNRLNNTAYDTGPGMDLVIGHINKWNKPYFGIKFVLPIQQTIEHF